jgi:hypothetical protein
MGSVALLGISAISTGLSIAGNISAYKTQAQQADQALRSHDRQLELARSTGELQAQQQSSERTRRYADVLSSQTAMWATRGIQLQSGTVRNIQDTSTDAYTRDVNTIELNRMNRMASIALQGADFQYAAANAVGAAHTRMVSGIASSLFSFASTAAGGGFKGFDFGSSGGQAAGSAVSSMGGSATGTAGSYGVGAPGFLPI